MTNSPTNLETAERAEMEPKVKTADLMEDMRLAASSIREWMPETLPANDDGQIHFARALAESAASAIEQFLAGKATAGEVEPVHPDDGYMRVVLAFDRNETAGAFLSEDGEGGFAAGVARMADEIDRLRRELAEARKALEPFANLAERADEATSDGEYCRHMFTYGRLRAARAALRAGEEGK